jgi:ribosome-dependent ATPase
MLVGLLAPSEGTATIFGHSVEAGSLEVRKNIGYMTQAFSLYEELTVRQNFVLDARLYHIPPERAEKRIAELVEKFGLGPYLDSLTADLPMGLRQRLSLAVAVLHDPQILILDEPTSGVDPLARESFWSLLVDLSRIQGVTIFVTTHFMTEGMYCDRISFMNAGKVLACDAPQKLIDGRGASSLEEAFIGYMEDAIGESVVSGDTKEIPANAAPAAAQAERSDLVRSIGRTMAYVTNEAMQILRDPVRLLFAFGGSTALMFVFGFGITTDVEHVRYAAFDLDRSMESQTYLDQFAGAPRYFTQAPPVTSSDDALRRLQANDISIVLEIPPGFGSDLRRGSSTEVLAHVDGANPFQGETFAQYVQGVQNTMLRDPSLGIYNSPPKYTAKFQDRYMYNPTFESVYAIVPSVPPVLLVLLMSILTVVSVVREKELGSIINFYVTPTRRIEYLLGKQIPYIAIGMMNYFILIAMSILVFGIPLKGSFLMLTLIALLYVTVTTGIGLVVSTFVSTQVAAVFVTAIITLIPSIQFSGLMQPVSTLDGSARIFGTIWPTSYYMHASVGAFTKGLGIDLLMPDAIFLACCIPVLWAVSTLALKKQEK